MAMACAIAIIFLPESVIACASTHPGPERRVKDHHHLLCHPSVRRLSGALVSRRFLRARETPEACVASRRVPAS